MGGPKREKRGSSWFAGNAGLLVLAGACISALLVWRWCLGPADHGQPKAPASTPTDDLDLVALLHDGGAPHETPSDLVAARAGMAYVARAEDRTIVAASAPDGAPKTLIQLDEPAWGVAVDASALWVTSTRGKQGVLEKIPLAGQAQPGIVSSGFARPRALASDGTSVFVVDEGAPTGDLLPRSTIVRVPAAGGDATTIASVEGVVTGVALDESSVYWADSLNGAILAAKKTGGAGQALVHDRGLPRDVVVDGDSLVWVEQRSESLWTLPVAGGTPRQLVQDFAGFAHLVASARGVWWVNEAAVDGTVRVFLLAHGASEPTAASPAVEAIDGLASDGSRVYWLRHGVAEPLP